MEGFYYCTIKATLQESLVVKCGSAEARVPGVESPYHFLIYTDQNEDDHTDTWDADKLPNSLYLLLYSS